jgi:hypothetical protein
MFMNRLLFLITLSILTFFTQCDTFKNLPTNTSGGLFSLNGNWQLISSSDNRAMEGTIVSVVPGLSDGTARTINNNNYCLRERDIVWRGLKSLQGGNFSLENLVSACDGTVVYKPGSITVIGNDEIKINSRTAIGAELLQTWRRAAI